MASTGLNFSNLTPDNGAIKDLKRLIFLAVTDPESLGKIFNFLPKQKHGEKVGFIGEFGMVGKASQGCNPTFGTSVLATSEKEWDIREWEVAEKICYKDLEGTVAQVAMRTKTNIADLTGTEYTDYILAPRLELAIRKMLMRYAWFGDKAADTVTDGGNLLDSIDPAYFTLVDGFWKRLFTLAAATPDRRTTCAANAAATFAEQKAAMRQNYAAVDFLDALISDASTVLRQANGQLIYITQALKDALDADLKRNNKGSELQWTALLCYCVPFRDCRSSMASRRRTTTVCKCSPSRSSTRSSKAAKPSAAARRGTSLIARSTRSKTTCSSAWRAKARSPTFRYGSTRTSR
jgi:hypothetical protein